MAEVKKRKFAEAGTLTRIRQNQFLASMSHELRTPLNAILGYARILRRHKDIQDELNIIWQSGNHLLTLINDILDLSKVEAGKTELYPEKISFSDFLDNIASIIRMQIQEKDIEFRYEPDPDLPRVIEADAIRLRQVLLNLLGNAVKFTDKGSVTLRVKLETRNSKLEARNPKPGYGDSEFQVSSFKFQIKDTGVGMTPEQMEKIFLPFEQAGAVGRRYEGTGLGLAISRQIVRLMGGEIHVLSEPDKGSLFWFKADFPVSDKIIEDEQKKNKIITGYKGKKQKILIVDDKKENRLVLRDILELSGFETDMAETGHEGIRKAFETKPDMILMDLVMPGMSGFEAAHKIREMPEMKVVPIIAVSASFLDINPRRIKEKGFDAFLPKPVDTDELLALLKKFMYLEWIYDKITDDEAWYKAEIMADTKIIPPPQEELKALYEMTMLGFMERVRARAKYLEGTDRRYIPFACRLKKFANNFEDEKLLSFIEKYMWKKL